MKKALFIPMLLAMMLVMPRLAHAQQWLYATPITVTNNVNSTVLGWQIPIYVNTQALISGNKMDAKGADLRFSKDCAGTKLLDYFIDSGMNTQKTKIWVKIDTLHPSADLIIYMLYGNSSASAASTYSTFNGPYSSTNQVKPGSTNTVSNCQRGFRFAPKRDIIISSFGKYAPNGTTRYVTIFDYATQAIVKQSQVSGSGGTYVYSNLNSHVWLAQNKEYVVELYNASGDQYYYGTSSQINTYLKYYEMKYCNSCTQNTFPTSTLSNYHYGVPDFRFYTVDTNNISKEPTYTFGGSGGGNAEITLGESPVICPGTMQADLPYFSTKGNPTEYSIQWNATAQGAGFADVNKAPITPSPLQINVPTTAPQNTYTGTLTMINQCGPGSSYPITVQVGGNVVVKDNPKDAATCPLGDTSFSVGAGGPDISYQWQVLTDTGWTDLNNGGVYNNVNMPTLKMTGIPNGLNGNKYRCIVNSSCASSSISAPGELTVFVDPTVVTNPADVVVTQGDNAIFEVKSASPNARYRWQAAAQNDTFAYINNGPIYTGVSTNKLMVHSVTKAQNGYKFRCVLSNGNTQCVLPGDTSDNAILSVNPPESVYDVANGGSIVTVYPNPTGSSEIFIKMLKTDKDDLTYKLVDKMGRTLRNGTVNVTGITNVNVADMPAGIYMIQITDSDNNMLSVTRFTRL